MRLSPTTNYYIRKLACHPSGLTNSETLELSTSALSNVDDMLRKLYPSTIEFSGVIQRLENLVVLHKHLHAQIFLYKDYAYEVEKLEKQIFHLLGFQHIEA